VFLCMAFLWLGQVFFGILAYDLPERYDRLTSFSMAGMRVSKSSGPRLYVNILDTCTIFFRHLRLLGIGLQAAELHLDLNVR